MQHRAPGKGAPLPLLPQVYPATRLFAFGTARGGGGGRYGEVAPNGSERMTKSRAGGRKVEGQGALFLSRGPL